MLRPGSLKTLTVEPVNPTTLNPHSLVTNADSDSKSIVVNIMMTVLVIVVVMNEYYKCQIC